MFPPLRGGAAQLTILALLYAATAWAQPFAMPDCPVDRFCCPNPKENSRTEICPYSEGVCCYMGTEQEGGYCCPPNHRCIAEYVQTDAEPSGANSVYRVSCWNNAGGNKPLELPDAAETVTLSEAILQASAELAKRKAKRKKAANAQTNNIWGLSENPAGDEHAGPAKSSSGALGGLVMAGRTVKKELQGGANGAVGGSHGKMFRPRRMRPLKLKRPDVVTLQNDNNIYGSYDEKADPELGQGATDTRLSRLTQQHFE